MEISQGLEFAIKDLSQAFELVIPLIPLAKRRPATYAFERVINYGTSASVDSQMLKDLDRLVQIVDTTGEPGQLVLEKIAALRTFLVEKGMRPRGISESGFLGETESLSDVIAYDHHILMTHNLTYSQIADKLEKVLQTVLLQREQQYAQGSSRYKEVDIAILCSLLSASSLELNNLLDQYSSFTVDNLEVFINHYRGFQACPWGCDLVRWSDMDFLLLNRTTGEFITCPGLIVHLIREHHFFEGSKSPYRVDPIRLAAIISLL